MDMKARLPTILIAFLWLGGCDPFSAVTTDDRVLTPTQAASFDLLVPGRRLPSSASNVHVYTKHFQDTVLYVRFNAPVGEARDFAQNLIGRPLARDGYVNMTGPDADWWISPDILQKSERGEDSIIDGDGLPAVSVAILPSGSTATVWIKTFDT